MTRCRSRAGSSTSRAAPSSARRSRAAGSRPRAPRASTPISSCSARIRSRAANHRFARTYWAATQLPGRPASVATDGEGRFRLTGIGRDRIVRLAVEGPTIQTRHHHRDDPQRGDGLHAEGCLRGQDDLRRDLRLLDLARPCADRRRPRQADQAAAGRRGGQRGRDERPHDDRCGRALQLARLPQREELRADGLGGRQAPVFRDLPGRARRRRPRSDPGRRRVRAGHPDAAQADRQGDGSAAEAGGSHLLAAAPQPARPRGPRLRPVRGLGAYSVGRPAGRRDLSPGRPAWPRGRVRLRRPMASTGRPASTPRRSSRSRRSTQPGAARTGSTAIGTRSSSPRATGASAACRRSSSAPSFWSIPPRIPAPSPPRPCSSATASARSACSTPTASRWRE